MSFLRRISILCLVVLAVPVLMGLWIGAEQLTGNFHEVIPGELYRSGQPSPDNIKTYYDRYHIRSVINLRDNISPKALAAEKAAAEKLGISFYHFPFSSHERLPVDKIHKLANLMKQAPKPLLIHCYHGANRTGLAAAVYLAEAAGEDSFSSGWQLSPYYGHISLPIVGRWAMRESWNSYKQELGL